MYLHISPAILSAILVLPGLFLPDAVTHPRTADSGPVARGSTCWEFARLLVCYLVRERKYGHIKLHFSK